MDNCQACGWLGSIRECEWQWWGNVVLKLNSWNHELIFGRVVMAAAWHRRVPKTSIFYMIIFTLSNQIQILPFKIIIHYPLLMLITTSIYFIIDVVGCSVTSCKHWDTPARLKSSQFTGVRCAHISRSLGRLTFKKRMHVSIQIRMVFMGLLCAVHSWSCIELHILQIYDLTVWYKSIYITWSLLANGFLPLQILVWISW